MQQKKHLRGVLLGFSLVFITGCSDTTPAVTALKSFSGLEFSPSQIVTSSLASVPLKAVCPAFAEEIELSFDSGQTWVSPTAHDPTSTTACVDGNFNILIKKANNPLNELSIVSGQTINLKFRAKMGALGWIQSDVAIKYLPATTIKQEILVGSQIQSGPGIQLKGRLRAQNQQEARGGSFVLRGRLTR